MLRFVALQRVVLHLHLFFGISATSCYHLHAVWASRIRDHFECSRQHTQLQKAEI